MKNPYYELWVDAIVNSKDYKNKESDWKVSLFFFITITNSLNIFVLLLWFNFLGINTNRYLLSFDSNIILSSAFGGLVNFGLPFAVLNYCAIFHKNRYLKLIVKYPSSHKGKLALIYILGSILLVVITIIITS